MQESPEMERAKRDTERTVEFLPNFKLNGKEVEPHIVIDVRQGKVRVIINRTKLCRTLSLKNQIQTALDLHLVDSVQTMLDRLAKNEQEAEEAFKKGGNQYGIPKTGTTGKDSTDSGQGGTETDNSGKFV